MRVGRIGGPGDVLFARGREASGERAINAIGPLALVGVAAVGIEDGAAVIEEIELLRVTRALRGARRRRARLLGRMVAPVGPGFIKARGCYRGKTEARVGESKVRG